MKSKKLITGAVAIALSTIMFTQAVPMELLQAAADELQELLTSEEIESEQIGTVNLSDKDNLGNGYIIEENVSKRTATTKEFVMSDDTIMVQQFGEAVHYLENGKYEEIDNALVEEKTEAGETYYRNSGNSFKVKFEKEPTLEGELISIEEDGYSLEFGYKSKNAQKEKKEKKIKTKAKGFEKKEKDYKYANKKLKHPVEQISTTGEITYENVDENTHLVYQLQNNGIKENIIVNEAQEEYSYTFKIKTKGLSLIENEDGSIYANTETGETKFVIPAPFMVDAAGQYSDAVYYTLTEYNNKAELTITADETWINEQASFPVTIDPIIESYTQTNFSSIRVSSDGTWTKNGALYAGKKNAGTKDDSFIRFELGSAPLEAELISASFSFDYTTRGMSITAWKDLLCGISVVESSMNIGDIRYNNKPKKLKELSGIDHTPQTKVTNAIYEKGTTNPYYVYDNALSFGIECLDGNSDGGYIEIQSPSLLLTYKNIGGIEDDYSMESFELNGATAYVNNATGGLTAVVDLASVNTLSDMPFEASLIYNSKYNAVLEGLGKTSIVGNGFKLNFQQFIEKQTDVYYLIDADGTICKFTKIGDTNQYYSKAKKLYYEPSGTNGISGTIKDAVGNKMEFTSGRLTKIVSENKPTEYIELTYASGSDRITKATYYENSIVKYNMKFEYDNTNGIIVAVTTNIDTNVDTDTDDIVLSTKILSYDTEKNLESIANKTGITDGEATGVTLITFGYNQFSTIYGAGKLENIYDNQKNGLRFDYMGSNKVEYVYERKAASDTSVEYREVGKTEFDYFNGYTQIYYYEGVIQKTAKHVGYNNSKKVISEWSRNEKGIISVQATSNWRDEESVGNEDYIEESFSYSHAVRSDTLFTIDGGKIRTEEINASDLGVEDSSAYTATVVFKASNDEEVHLKVTIGSEIEEIQLTQGGCTYVCIPYSLETESKDVKIENLGTKTVEISYFSYKLMDSVVETSAYDETIAAHKLSTTQAQLLSGKQIETTYDEKQRVEFVKTKNVMDDTYYERTSYTYVVSGFGAGKIDKIQTTKHERNGNAEVGTSEISDYTYELDEYSTYTEYMEEVITTKGTLSQKTSTTKKIESQGVTITNIDENNVQTKEYYKITNGDMRLWKVVQGNAREEYTYNNLGQITNIKVYEGSNQTLVFSQTDHYDEKGVYLGSSYGGTKYSYTYDETGYITSIGYGGTGATDSVTPLLEYTYNDTGDGLDSNRISKKTYANGDREEYKYIPLSKGSRAQVEHVNENGVSVGKYIYYYNANGAMTSQEYQKNNKGQVTYNYGDLSWMEENTLTIYGLEFYLQYRQEYDILTKRLESVGISTMIDCMSTDEKSLYYTYDKEGQISAFSYNLYDVEYEYDGMERLTNRVVPLLYSYENNVNESYVYKTYGNGYTTNFLTLIDDETEVNNDRTATYDANGYITGVSYNGDAYTYTYDNVGRLAQETKNGEVVGTYTYDDKNNVQKTGLTYTNGKLTAVNGAQIVYDDMGNPTTYKGKTLVWEQGRKLTKITSSGKTVTYSYDGNGMRYEKIVGGVKTNYYWNEDQLIMESKNGSRTYYIYGVTGIEGMIVEKDLEDTYYYFDKNTLGDVIAIRDEDGDIVATYEYDAWGNHKVYNASGATDTNQSSIGNINPFRYRGYYYDTETGFYYLQTRYYDPTICRFINADDYELVAELSQMVGQLNLYAYANNNPIMYTDPTGEMLGLTILLIDAGIGAFVGITAYEISLLDEIRIEVSPEKDNVKIENSHLIHTPWVQWGYSFYLNHINPETKDIIKGTTFGVQSEWAAHNLGYYGLSALKVGVSLFGGDTNWIENHMDYAKAADIGATVFDNPDSPVSKVLIAYNIITNPIATLIDYYLVYKKG